MNNVCQFYINWLKITTIRAGLQQSIYQPQGFNIGINDGKVAGQTVKHAHIHVIPRYRGDHKDPRGGIRAVIPGKKNYL